MHKLGEVFAGLYQHQEQVLGGHHMDQEDAHRTTFAALRRRTNFGQYSCRRDTEGWEWRYWMAKEPVGRVLVVDLPLILRSCMEERRMHQVAVVEVEVDVEELLVLLVIFVLPSNPIRKRREMLVPRQMLR